MLPPDPADCQMELLVQFFQIQADQIFHFHSLQSPLQPFHRIQIRCICRQRIHHQPVCTHRRNECPHICPPVVRRPVPHHQCRPTDFSANVLQERHGVLASQWFPSNLGEHSAVRCQATHNRQVVVRLPLGSTRRSSLETLGPHPAGQQIESRFVHENQCAALVLGSRFQRRPVRVGPTCYGDLVALNGHDDR